MKSRQRLFENRGNIYVQLSDTINVKKALVKLYEDNDLIKCILTSDVSYSKTKTEDKNSDNNKKYILKHRLSLALEICKDCTMQIRKHYGNDPRFFSLIIPEAKEREFYITPEALY